MDWFDSSWATIPISLPALFPTCARNPIKAVVHRSSTGPSRQVLHGRHSGSPGITASQPKESFGLALTATSLAGETFSVPTDKIAVKGNPASSATVVRGPRTKGLAHFAIHINSIVQSSIVQSRKTLDKGIW
jgi:hypothetical protein